MQLKQAQLHEKAWAEFLRDEKMAFERAELAGYIEGGVLESVFAYAHLKGRGEMFMEVRNELKTS